MSLLGISEPSDKPRGRRSKNKIGGPRGCEYCPLDGVKGIRKIKGKVKGRDIFVWAQSPGRDENEIGKELIGRAGRWFWKEMKRAGISRKQCDVQNIVRCLPADRKGGQLRMRDPSPEEVHCCSLYSDRARLKSKARVWLVLGKYAKEQLFGKVTGGSIFFEGDTQVFLLDHPAFFLRGAPPERLERFREMLALAKSSIDREGSPKFGFLKDMQIRLIGTKAEAFGAVRDILEMAGETGYIAVDEEDDKVGGKRVTLCVGFCPKPGYVWVFLLDHPGNDASEEDREAVRGGIRQLLDTEYVKAMHHGVYDDDRFEAELGVRARNFLHDTEFSSFIADPGQQSYSLMNVVARKLPQFAGYKDLTLPEAVPRGMSVEQGRKSGEFHLARVPMARMCAYNACDCHVTAELKERINAVAPENLVRVYTEASFVFERMRKFGPLLDFDQTSKVERLFPVRQARLLRKLQKMAYNPDFNPNASQQVKRLVYDVWKIPPIDKKKNTRKLTLEIMLDREPHDGLRLLIDYRDAKTRADRVMAFRRSAEANDGRVTTFWRLTGTRTGRMSSGGKDRPDQGNLGNLQNIPSDTHVKNMLVSALDWRSFADHAVKKGTASALKKFGDMEVFIARDYSQMELRILAQMTGEKPMIKMFNSGKDIHAGIGSEWSNWDFTTIQTDSKIRRIVKGMHFGIIYGLSAASLRNTLIAQGVDIELETAEEYMKQYWARFKAASRYRDDMPKTAKNLGYVENLFGFRTPIDSTDKRSSGVQWENQAVNAPIQGAAHQVLLCAVSLLQRHPERYRQIRPQMEIHDSLIAVTKLRDVEEAIDSSRLLLEDDARSMTAEEFGIDWKVPLKTDAQIGFRYGGMVEWTGDIESTMREVVRGAIKDDRELDGELADV